MEFFSVFVGMLFLGCFIAGFSFCYYIIRRMEEKKPILKENIHPPIFLTEEERWELKEKGERE